MKKLFRSILLIVNLLFVALLLGSTLAGVCKPSHFVAFSFLSYGYFIFLLVNVLFILIWLFMGRWEFLVSLVAILVRYPFLPLFFQLGGTPNPPSPEECPDADIVKMMTFNVHGFHGPDDSLSADTGAAMFLQLVRENSPDILCLQEYFSPHGVNATDSLEAMGYIHRYGPNGYGLIILSKFPFSYVDHNPDPAHFCVEVNHDRHPFYVCSVHLNSYQLDGEDKEGLEAIMHGSTDTAKAKRIYRKFRRTIFSHEHQWENYLSPLVDGKMKPLVVLGDFNDTPASYLYQMMSRNMVDSYTEQGRGFCTTYHGPFPDFRIDHVFHSPDIHALSYRRIKSDASDHYPILVSLDMKKH